MFLKIDLIEGLSFMKTKYSLLFLLVFCSLNTYSAFNAVENSQLEDINSKSQKEVEQTISSLDDAQNFQMRNNPEKKYSLTG